MHVGLIILEIYSFEYVHVVLGEISIIRSKWVICIKISIAKMGILYVAYFLPVAVNKITFTAAGRSCSIGQCHWIEPNPRCVRISLTASSLVV